MKELVTVVVADPGLSETTTGVVTLIRRHSGASYSKIMQAVASGSPVHSCELDPQALHEGLRELVELVRALAQLRVPFNLYSNGSALRSSGLEQRYNRLQTMTLEDFR